MSLDNSVFDGVLTTTKFASQVVKFCWYCGDVENRVSEACLFVCLFVCLFESRVFIENR